MKRRMKKLMSLLLSVSMVFSVFTMPVYASPADGTESEQTVESETTETEDNTTDASEAAQPEETQPETAQPEETQPQTTTVEESYGTLTLNANDLEVSDVTPHSVAVDEEVQVDENDPVMTSVEEELGSIKVLNDDGESVALTEDQIQQALQVYQQYQDQWKANANLLGVQMPFFLQFNDDGEDGLGVMGEMLVLAGYSVDQVRNGEYSFDDLMMMIQNFLYADQYGLEYYSEAIVASRKEVLKAVEESGATTMVQKMLVINDWLAHHTNFDMAYIMQDDDGNPIMVAEEEVPHEHYNDLFNAMKEVYTKQYHDQIYQGIKQNIYDQALEAANSNHDAIFSQVKQGLLDSGYEDNEETDAIAEEQTQAQIKQIAEDAVTDAEENGVDVEQEDGTTVHKTLEELTQEQLAAPQENLGGASLNDIIPMIAQGMAEGIIGAWEGNHIGVLAEGIGVCAGYSKAFAYLLQYMSPEIYGINGKDSNMDDAEQWKTADQLYYSEDGKTLDINQNYLVDMVRITFDANVSMFGEESPFGEVHFWNAVKVDGKWYYVDPCYTDIYVECMSRDRVEIDGTMNHMYFMFSHTTALKMYDGNMDEDLGITTLYADAATDQSYEDSWFARVSSNAYSDGENFYYLYDSTDMLAMLNEYNNMQGAGSDQEFSESDFEALMEGSDPDYKLVYHPITGDDIAEGGADSDFKVLIDFNPKDEDDNTLSAQVYNPETGDLEDNELLTELFAQYKEECDIYPSIKMTAALYGDKLYFNLSNCVLSYDLGSGKVEKVKEYNTVYASCDPTIAFRGMAYSVTDEETDMKVTNRPIAALTIKDDGQMYVSIATNFAFISGKDGVNDTEHYGYAYEESNYNPNYSSYMKGDSAEMEAMGYSEETNDNDEFMWSAVFVDTINVKSSCSHSSTETVTVEPFCGRDGYTEERCTSCGAPIDGTRVVDEGSALEHHYIHFEETYYTKDDSGNWNTGDCYVCTICGSAVEEPEEPGEKNAQESQEDYDERVAEYEKEKAEYDAIVESAGHTYEPTDASWSEDSASVTFSHLECSSVCPEKQSKLDCLLEDGTISVDLDEEVTAEAEVTGHKGECTTGVTDIYTAEGTATKGDATYTYTASNEVPREAGEHSYVADFVWEEAEDEEAEVPYTVTATEVKCEVCGAKAEGTLDVKVGLNEDKSVAPTCEKDGKNVYTATATVTNDDEEVIATATEDKSEDSDVVPATGHDYDAVWDWKETEEGSEHEITPTLTLTCQNDETEEPIVLTEGDGENDIKVTVDDSQSTATCTDEGVIVYNATVEYGGETYDDSESVTVEALGHKYKAEFTWTEKEDADGKGTGEVESVTATVKCTNGCKFEAEDVIVEFAKVADQCVAPTCTEAGKNVYTATATFTDAEEKENSVTSDEEEFEVPATGHNYEPAWEWKETEEGAENPYTPVLVLTCQNDETEEPITLTEGEDGIKVTVDDSQSTATCTDEGVIVYNASVEYEGKTYEDKKEVTEPALGHEYEATFTWNEEKDSDEKGTGEVKSATAKVVCINGCEFEAEDVEVEVATVADQCIAPTCTEAGKNVYTATATFTDAEGKENSITSEEKEFEVPATGHAYKNDDEHAEWTWADADENAEVPYTATLVLTCTNEGCGTKTDVLDATVELDEKSTSATCTEKGTAVYRATVGYEGQTFTSEKSVEVDALGHTYEAKWTWTKVDDKDAKVPYKASAVLTCKICEDKTESIEADNVEITSSTEATCTEDGETTYTASITYNNGQRDVDYYGEKTIVTKATGHDYGEWETVKEATDSEAGEEKRTCSKCGEAESRTIESMNPVSVLYQTHVQSIGWEDEWAEDGQMSGTEGQALRLESIKIKLDKGKLDYSGDIVYTTHVQTYGWLSEVQNGSKSGTEGESKRLEAIKIYLTGEMAEKYDVYYCVHAQTYGWLNWAKNGEYAGTAGLSKRLEGIKIVLVKKGEKAPESLSKETRCYVTNKSSSGESSSNLITYRTHVQTYGWQDWKYDGVMSGTSGESKRLEAIQIKLPANMTTDDKVDGSIKYMTHIQSIGWEKDWTTNGKTSGTSGRSLRLEGIKIKLTGDLAKKYDIYYCVHAQTYGWLGWAKNGEEAGTEGLSKRLEGIKIVLVEKGGKAPKALSNQPAFIKK